MTSGSTSGAGAGSGGGGGSSGSNSAVSGRPAVTVSFDVGASLNALAPSPNKDHVVVAGRDVLKVLAVSDNQAREAVNLRLGSRVNLNSSSNDVKWGGHMAPNTIVTAATNGAIVTWDLQKSGTKLERLISEHGRAVNRIAFHPTEPAVLLSASQDGTMKLWDLRTNGAAKATFEGKCESARDVQFSPVAQYEFVAAFENGAVQRWDTRAPQMFEKKIAVHNGLVLSVDYHSNGRLLATGGRDKFIQVLDLKSAARLPSVYTIQAIASVGRVAWRPVPELQIASTAMLTDNRIQLHDVTRPFVPMYTMGGHNNVITGMCWVDSDVIWSCSKDKFFVKRDVRNGTRPLDTLPANSVAWSCTGDISFAAEDYAPLDKSESAKTPSGFTSLISRRTQKKPAPTERSPADLSVYRPSQKLGHVDTETFDVYSFAFKAMHYRTDSADIAATCQHNAQVALELEHYRSSQTWAVLELLYAQATATATATAEALPAKPVSASPSGISPGNAAPRRIPNILDQIAVSPPSTGRLWDAAAGQRSFTADSASSMSESHSTFSQSLSKAPSALLPLPLTTAAGGAGGSSTEPSSQMPSRSASIMLSATPAALKLDPIVLQTLDFYANQGDVQMCVTIALVLELQLTLDNKRLEGWFLGYIELLHRFQLWNVAADMIRACKLPAIRACNQESTTIYTTCNNCFRPILNSNGKFWHCERCKKLVNTCSIW
ncbi:SEA (Seh1-associated) complex subunit [Sorochytrium milnesiophthora]